MTIIQADPWQLGAEMEGGIDFKIDPSSTIYNPLHIRLKLLKPHYHKY